MKKPSTVKVEKNIQSVVEPERVRVNKPFTPDLAKGALDLSTQLIDGMINNVCHKQWEKELLEKKLKPHTARHTLAVTLETQLVQPKFVH